MTQLLSASIARGNATAGELFQIANAAQDSNVISWNRFLSDSEALSIFSPNGLAETITIQISPDYTEDESGTVTNAGTWFTLNDLTNTAVLVPTANNVIVYNGVISACKGIKLHAGVAVAAARNFMAYKSFRA